LVENKSHDHYGINCKIAILVTTSELTIDAKGAIPPTDLV
jgi:hypothetical protein